MRERNESYVYLGETQSGRGPSQCKGPGHERARYDEGSVGAPVLLSQGAAGGLGSHGAGGRLESGDGSYTLVLLTS